MMTETLLISSAGGDSGGGDGGGVRVFLSNLSGIEDLNGCLLLDLGIGS